MRVYRANGKWLDFSRVYTMGILNLTPDSFSDGGRYPTLSSQVEQFESLVAQGAEIIDVGGQSTRPFATLIPAEQEWQRIQPFLDWWHQHREEYPSVLVSVDTFWPEVARRALDLGVHIINDVQATYFDEMIALCKEYGASYVLTHSQGTPQTMQIQPSYSDVILEIYAFFLQKLRVAYESDFLDIIVDPGFGFGKSVEHNYEIVRYMEVLTGELGLPVLVGVSRKSMITKLFQDSWQNLVPLQEVLHYELILSGARIIRVHEPKWIRKIAYFLESSKMRKSR